MNNVITIGPRLSNEQDRERQRMRMLADVLGGNQYGGPAGGLRSAGESIAKAYMYKQEQERMEKADAANNKALADMLKGGTAKPWVNPDTGQVSSAPAGGYEGMLAGLSNNPNSELARTLAPELVQARIAREQSLADAEAARKRDQETWEARFNTQRQASLEDMEQELMLKAQYGVGGQQDPAAVQEWKYYASLPDDQKAQYLTMKRANPWVDRGDAKVLTNPAQPGTTMAEMPVGLPPKREIKDGQVITMPAMAGGQTPIPPGGPSIQQAGSMPQPAAAMPGTEQAGPGGVQTVALPKTPEQIAQQQQKEAIEGRASDVVLTDIDRALGMLDNSEWYNPVAGFGAETASEIAGSNSADFKALTDTIRGNIGFDRLQQMRDSSPTGGALGAINEQELKTLQSVLGNLEQSQSPEQLRYNMTRLKNMYLDIVHGPNAGPPRVPLAGPQTQPVSGNGNAAPQRATEEDWLRAVQEDPLLRQFLSQ
jgi:hypothetical protein